MKKLSIIFVGISITLGCVLGATLNDSNKVQTLNNNSPDTALTIKVKDLEEELNMVTHIVKATVVEKGKETKRESTSFKMKLTVPVTPVTFKVQDIIYGELTSDQIQSDQITVQMPGRKAAQDWPSGMETILILRQTEHGLFPFGDGIWTVRNGKVYNGSDQLQVLKAYDGADEQKFIADIGKAARHQRKPEGIVGRVSN